MSDNGKPTIALDGDALAHTEMLLLGAYAPLTGFLTTAEEDAVRRDGRLPDGREWPVPITLTIPNPHRPDQRPELSVGTTAELVDPEGTPLAELTISERVETTDGIRLAGDVRQLRMPTYGPFQHLRETAETVRSFWSRPATAALVDQPLPRTDQVRLSTGRDTGLLLLVPTGADDRPANETSGLSPVALADVTVEAMLDIDRPTTVIALGHRTRTLLDQPELVQAIAANYGAPEITHAGDGLDPRELRELLDADAPISTELFSRGVAAKLRRHRPPKSERGLVVFFTGLSGSGKSTVARGLAAHLTRSGARTVSLLDGDVVRRMLSAGLTFSRADRDLNIRRIGYVAAEIARHGGTAICAPIAPYAATRQEVRRMVEPVGDFVLIHVSTPLEVCEARDTKGLYAKARAGLIPEFTGISDPYEVPTDAYLTLDTSTGSEAQAVDDVLALLRDGGWID